MLLVYYGNDRVSARLEAEKLAKSKKMRLWVLESGQWPEKDTAMSLFGETYVYFASDLLTDAEKKNLRFWMDSASLLVIYEEKLTQAQKKDLPKDTEIKKFEVENLPGWFVSKVASYGGKIDPALAVMVLDRLGVSGKKGVKAEDLLRLDGEAGKLATYAGGKKLTKEEVVRLVALGEGNAFAWIDLFLAGSLAKGFEELKRLYEFDPDENAVSLQLCAVLADNLRWIRFIQVVNREKKPALFSESGLADWKLKKLQVYAKSLSENKVVQVLEKLYVLDAEIKSSGLPSRAVLELVLLDFAR